MSEVVEAQSRRIAIVSAAQDEFFAHGYGATSMSAIAARIGGSKTTLWSYFPSKQDLFAAVVKSLASRFAKSVEVPINPNLPVEKALRSFAWSVMRIVEKPEIIALHRLVTAECGRFPELGALLFEQGPGRSKAKLASYISSAMADGRVRPGDPDRAASQFMALFQSGIFQDRLWGLLHNDEAPRISDDINDAIEVWLGGWEANPSRASADTANTGVP